MDNLAKLKYFHDSAAGLLIMAIIEFTAGYFLGWRAVDTGSDWQWIMVIVLITASIQNLLRVVWRVIHGRKPKTTSA